MYGFEAAWYSYNFAVNILSGLVVGVKNAPTQGKSYEVTYVVKDRPVFFCEAKSRSVYRCY